mmetsp:Transcript_18955/g.51369  ORF Transcript_18955/g.51369 Transcript_18955/m.51369 type:complete len:110 (-) Transcript_18955:89-418(-)|eukprot:1128196-Prymnesium_polylepis.1
MAERSRSSSNDFVIVDASELHRANSWSGQSGTKGALTSNNDRCTDFVLLKEDARVLSSAKVLSGDEEAALRRATRAALDVDVVGSFTKPILDAEASPTSITMNSFVAAQ